MSFLGSSDIQVLFPFLIVVILIAVLSSFFIVHTDNSLSLQTPEGFVVPFSPDPAFANNSSGSGWGTPEGAQPDWVAGALGVAFWGASIAALFLALPTGGFSLLVPVGLSALGTTLVVYAKPGGVADLNQVMHGVPLLGALWDGLRYGASIIQSFGGMINYSLGVLAEYPMVAAIVVIPIVMVFFMVILRYIRGQG